MLFSNCSDHIVDHIINQVLKISQRCFLTLLVCQESAFVLLELLFGIIELAFHLVVPIFDALQHTCVLVVLVLTNLLLSLCDLFLLEVCQL